MKTEGKRFIMAEDSLEIYRRITGSQGNMSDEEVSSGRYGDTVTIGSGGDRDSAQGPGSSREKEDYSAGPGAAGEGKKSTEDTSAEGKSGDLGGSSQVNGPTVVEVSISEKFHEDFGVYEEALNNSQFFYATVSNGGITDKGVSVELPANMEYVLEKDGLEIPYTSGQTLAERGSYVLRITVIEDPSLPFSEQKLYKSTFRFRIQERLHTTASPENSMGDMPYGFQGGGYGGSYGGGYSTGNFPGGTGQGTGALTGETGLWTAGGQSGQTGESGTGGAGGQPGQTGGTGTGGAGGQTGEAGTGGTDGQTGEGGQSGESGAGENGGRSGESGTQESGAGEEQSRDNESGENGEAGAGAGELMGEDGTIDGDALEAAIGSVLGSGYGEEAVEGYNPVTGLASAYDQDSGYYHHQLASGEVFFTDVPNGMVTNHSVMILTNDSLPFKVYKDGEILEYVPGTAIEERGSYSVYPYSDSAVYLSTYTGKQKPLFQFRILGEVVNDMGIVNAPEKGRIAKVRFKERGQEETKEYTPQSSWYSLADDRNYQIDLETETGISTVAFEKDTVSPRFYYGIEGSHATVEYVSPDVEGCRISKDGVPIYEGSPVTDISDPGNYQLTVYDRAGNASTASMEVPYKMNTAAVLTIVIAVLLVAIGVLFARRVSKQVKVV